ncbi:MAG: hypothetical protein ACLQBB_05910 [Solirubrobacteraceae bacterium]
MGSLALLLATPALSHAAESNPNNYSCLGSLASGTAEEGSEEQQVGYSFYCDGPVTGYQIQAQVPVTGLGSSPLVSALAVGGTAGAPLKDIFSCSGEVPGYALNCVGAAKAGYELIAGQFAIGKKLCVEPRVDALLTVTYAYLEKGVVTQAISGPFDLGRPKGCPPDAYSGDTRLNPKPLILLHKKKDTKKHKKAAAKKSAHRARKAARPAR